MVHYNLMMGSKKKGELQSDQFSAIKGPRKNSYVYREPMSNETMNSIRSIA